MPNHINHIELRSEEVQDILEATPNWMIRWGNILILSIMLILLFISWFVKYPDIISSNAVITTEIPPQKEYATTNGKISSILVNDNENVDLDSPLAIIENTANHNHVFFLKSILDTITLNNTSFEFPINNIPALFLGDIEAEYALFENNYLQYLLNKQHKPFSNQAKANDISRAELQLRLKTLQSQKQINASELEYQKKNLERNRILYDRGTISAQDFESIELSYLQAKRNFANMESSISQIRESISNAKKTSKDTDFNETIETISLFKNVIQSYNQLKRAIKDWELRYVLKSNINGKVSFVNDWKVNQTVAQGELIFTIIPEQSSSYVALLRSPAQNSGKLKIGQTVNIKLETYPDTEFGVLSGVVKSISISPDKDGLYLVKTDLPEKLITSYKREIHFKYEMNGTAEIITEDLRLIERFFYRLKNIINN